MDLNHSTDPTLANIQTTKQIPETSTKYPSATGTASMFDNTKNPIFMGGTFNNTHNTNNFKKIDGLDVLHKRVAPNAILNAGGRAYKVRCLRRTREEVIGRIEKWRDAQGDQTPPIFWLSGSAGAGKSAIMQTIADRCKAQGVPQANFFFFHADGSRNNASPLVATLLYQIIMLYPSLWDPVADVFSDNPLILDSLLEEQLAQLLVTPLRAVPQLESSFRPILLLIDGLDECDSKNNQHQRQILHAFDKVLVRHSCPFRLLVASRDESQIASALTEISSSFFPFYIDSDFSESDIRIYVQDRFEQVRKTHPLSRTLDATWPSVYDVEGIVEKSSGQFMYAAIVMDFISHSSASPAVSLQRVMGAAPIAFDSPFAQLDAIYSCILSQVDDQEALKDILNCQLLLNNIPGSYARPGLVMLLHMLDTKYADALVRSRLADLTSIAHYSGDGKLVFTYTSFSEYLLDQSRSGDYFVDIDAFNFKIVPAVFKWVGITPEAGGVAHFGVLRLEKLPPDLLNTLCALDPSTLMNDEFHSQAVVARIYNLCTCEDDVMKFKQFIRGWINNLRDSDILKGCDGDERIPCSRRYFMMAHLKRNLTMTLSDKLTTALRPETNFDIHETALWLVDLLHRIHREYYSREIGIYKQLLKQWIFWATQNDIPLDDLDGLPGARRCFWKRRMAKWAARHLKIGSGRK